MGLLTDMDEMKGASKDLWDAYYAKNPGGWSGFDGFSAIDSGQTTPDVAEAKLLGYYNDLPVYGGGYLGVGSFNGNDPYFGTYYNIDDKGNVTTQESKRYTGRSGLGGFLSVAAPVIGSLVGSFFGGPAGLLGGKAASTIVKYIGNELTQDGYPATGVTPTSSSATSSSPYRNYILAGLLSSMGKQQTPVFSDYTPIAPTVTAPTIATESAANFKPVTSDRTRVLHDYSGDQEKQRTIAEILSNPYKGYLSDYLNYLA